MIEGNALLVLILFPFPILIPATENTVAIGLSFVAIGRRIPHRHSNDKHHIRKCIPLTYYYEIRVDDEMTIFKSMPVFEVRWRESVTTDESLFSHLTQYVRRRASEARNCVTKGGADDVPAANLVEKRKAMRNLGGPLGLEQPLDSEEFRGC
jgi:hypothetical protein